MKSMSGVQDTTHLVFFSLLSTSMPTSLCSVYVLRLTQVEANVDLKRPEAKVLEGRLQDQGESGASATTSSNSQWLSTKCM